MGHHIDDKGRFQSDKYPELSPDKIILSFKDPHAWGPLVLLADNYRKDDIGLAEDIYERVRAIKIARKRTAKTQPSDEMNIYGPPYPKYCCQRCGAQIGYMGRAFDFILVGPLHQCLDGDQRGLRNLGYVIAASVVIILASQIPM